MRRLGIGLMALGLGLILAAGALVGYNLRQDRRGREAAALGASEVRQQITLRRDTPDTLEVPPGALLPSKVLPVEEVDGFGYIGNLSIPVLELELPIMDDWSYARLRKAPCRQSGSTARDLVIAGHNYQSHFGRLNTLAEGDILFFTDMDGEVTAYRVDTVATIRPTDVDLVMDDGWDLVLYTCTYGGRSRVMVGCHITEETKDKLRQTEGKTSVRLFFSVCL